MIPTNTNEALIFLGVIAASIAGILVVKKLEKKYLDSQHLR